MYDIYSFSELQITLVYYFIHIFIVLQVRWMMYWIVFALYTVTETVADQTVAW